MLLPVRLFNSKNRRTPLQITPRRPSGQSVDEQIRALQSAWGDVLSLPLCLGTLALYEWWRWLFSIPSNPLLLTLVAAVAVRSTWRRRRVYMADLKLLRLGQAGEPTLRQLAGLLHIAGARLRDDVSRGVARWSISPPARWALSPATWLAKRLTARS